MLAGGLAGIAAKSAVAPFERVRILAQTGHGAGSMFATGGAVLRREGVVGLWRGNFVNCVRVFPSRGILFSFNDTYKGVLARLAGLESQDPSGAAQDVPFWLSFTAGASAGMTACLFTYPLDVARTRLAGRFVQSGAAEASMVSTLVTMLRKEGLRAWYRGIGPTLLGSLPYEGVKFAAYDWAVKTHRRLNPEAGDVVVKLSSGAFGGAVAGLCMYPNDTVRRLLQMQGLDGQKPKYRSAWHCWVTVYRQEGLSRFFRGISPYLVRVVPNSAIQFGVYEALKVLML